LAFGQGIGPPSAIKGFYFLACPFSLDGLSGSSAPAIAALVGY